MSNIEYLRELHHKKMNLKRAQFRVKEFYSYEKDLVFRFCVNTQVNRMSRSRRVLATGGKQRILGLDMVCIETILFHLDSF